MMDDVKPVIVILVFIFIVLPSSMGVLITTINGIEFRRNVELFNLVSKCRQSANANYADVICGPLPKFENR